MGFWHTTTMAETNNLKERLEELRALRKGLHKLQKEAFMAAPPMPAQGGGGAPPMDPAMAGGAPPQGMPPQGMPPQGMPPGGGPPVDPATGMPIDPNTGMPMDPNAMGGGDPGGQVMTPEMLDELLGVIEELAASNEQQEQKFAQMEQAIQECMAKCDEIESRAAEAAVPADPMAGAGPGWQ